MSLKHVTGMHYVARPERVDLLVITKSDQEMRLNLNKVPNAHVLALLLEDITGWPIYPADAVLY